MKIKWEWRKKEKEKKKGTDLFVWLCNDQKINLSPSLCFLSIAEWQSGKLGAGWKIYRLSWSQELMKQLEFEKVGDINSFFPYLCVYFKGESEPFMDIGISEKEAIEFTFYPGRKNLVLSISQWNELSARAQVFLMAELQNKEFE